MIYKTVYGYSNGTYIISKYGVYWFDKPMIHKGTMYVLLKKNYKGSYQVIRLLQR